MKYALTVIISGICAFLMGAFGIMVAYRYVPLGWFTSESPVLGSTITTINGSDTISSSRSVINTNFSNLNATKAEISDVSGTTTLSSLAKVGTITTGTWNATPITVPYGGTGSTTLSTNQVLIGNGAGNIGIVPGYGNSGQFLTSNGNGSAPSWTSASFNTGIDYTLTGMWNFNYGFFSAKASSTAATTTALDVTGLARFTSASATTTFSGNVGISGNATTTNLTVSNICSHCVIAASTSTVNTLNNTPGNTTTINQSCTGNTSVIAGGFSGLPNTATNGSAGYEVVSNYPSASNVWTVGIYCAGAACNAGTVTTYAICANP